MPGYDANLPRAEAEKDSSDESLEAEAVHAPAVQLRKHLRDQAFLQVGLESAHLPASSQL